MYHSTFSRLYYIVYLNAIHITAFCQTAVPLGAIILNPQAFILLICSPKHNTDVGQWFLTFSIPQTIPYQDMLLKASFTYVAILEGQGVCDPIA